MEIEEVQKLTIKEMQQVAATNGFYLCPLEVWNRTLNTIDEQRSEIKKVKISRDKWKEKLRLEKSKNKIKKGGVAWQKKSG